MEAAGAFFSSVSGTYTFVDNAVTGGETPLTLGVQGALATDLVPQGGSIAFDSSTSWSFVADTGTTEQFSGSDFFSVALHEPGHLLGFDLSEPRISPLQTQLQLA